MQRRYAILHVISFLFRLGAILLLLVALGGLAFALARLAIASRGHMGVGQWAQIGVALFVFLWGIAQFMVLYAVGEALNVLMAIEENTRATSLRLVRLLSLLTEEKAPPLQEVQAGEAADSTEEGLPYPPSSGTI